MPLATVLRRHRLQQPEFGRGILDQTLSKETHKFQQDGLQNRLTIFAGCQDCGIRGKSPGIPR
jgi:hypothetical protein